MSRSRTTSEKLLIAARPIVSMSPIVVADIPATGLLVTVKGDYPGGTDGQTISVQALGQNLDTTAAVPFTGANLAFHLSKAFFEREADAQTRVISFSFIVKNRDGSTFGQSQPADIALEGVPSLSFGGPQQLDCTGYSIAEGRPPRTPATKAIYTRTPVGGVLPYTYVSSDTKVAVIRKVGGAAEITAVANGNSTITVRDASGKEATHALTVVGMKVWRHLGSWNALTYDSKNRILEAAADLVRCPSNRAEVAEFRAAYSAEGSDTGNLVGWGDGYYWTDEVAKVDFYYAVHLNSGTALPIYKAFDTPALMALVV